MSKPYNERSAFGKLRYQIWSKIVARSQPVDAQKDREDAAALVVRALNIFKRIVDDERVSAYILLSKTKIDDAAQQFLKMVLAKVIPRVIGGMGAGMDALQEGADGIRALNDEGRTKALRSLAAASYQEELRQRGESVPSFDVAGVTVERTYQQSKMDGDA